MNDPKEEINDSNALRTTNIESEVERPTIHGKFAD